MLSELSGAAELALVSAQWVATLGVVAAASTWAWLSLGGGRSLRVPPHSQ
jgi:hypothetical protein